MISNEQIKLTLLTQSKNRLLAAEAHDWERLEQLDLSWNHFLEETIETHPELVQACRDQLIADNDALLEHVKHAEKTVLLGLQKEVSSLKSIQAYLK